MHRPQVAHSLLKMIELFEKKLVQRNLSKTEFSDSGLNTAAGQQFSQGQKKAASDSS